MKRPDGFRNLERNLGKRAGADRQEKRKLRAIEPSDAQSIPEIQWGFSRGDFSDFRKYTEDEIGSPEQDVIKHIRSLLERRKKTGDLDRPVIAVDFGGMFGLSMAKIAAELTEEIQGSRLVLAVTNLAFPIQKGIEALKIGTLPKQQDIFFDEDKDTLLKQSRLLHYLTSDAAELRDQTISLPDGRTIALDGNIDFLHEHMALIHSRKADVDLPLLARRMSADGVMAIHSTWSYPKSNEPREATGLREDAMRLGFQNVTDLGFEAPIKSNRYQLFRRPGVDVSAFQSTVTDTDDFSDVQVN